MENAKIFAHRGLNRQAPENTIAAFEAAWKAGVPWLETDTDRILDGTPIVMHDSHTDRTTNRSASLYDLSLDELRALDAGSWFSPEFKGEHVPTLAETIDFINAHPINLNLELKGNEQGKEGSIALIESVLAELSRLNDGIDVMICSFSPLMLAETHRRAPELPLALVTMRGLLGDDWRSVMELCGATLLHPEAEMLNPDMVAAVRAEGYDVNPWTINDRALANQLLNWGCTGLITDIADEFVG